MDPRGSSPVKETRADYFGPLAAGEASFSTAAARMAPQSRHQMRMRFHREAAFQRIPPASQTERELPHVQQRIRH